MDLLSVSTTDLGDDLTSEIRGLMDASFDDFSDDDWEHSLGGTHVVARDGPELLGHAALVPRGLELDGRRMAAGYVEAMAVASTWRRRGVGRAILDVIHARLATDYDFGALSASAGAVPFYRAAGWWQWRGTTWVHERSGSVTHTADDDRGIFVHGGCLPLDLRSARYGRLVCDWRPGDVW